MSFNKKTHSFASFFLLLVFITMQLVQVMHVHLGASHNKAFISQPGKACKQSLSRQVSKCLICDYQYHRQHSYAPGAIHFSFSCFVVQPVSFNISYTQRLFESSVHTWSNKGPPTCPGV